MNLTTDQVLDAALALPENDLVELVEALIVSLEPVDQPPLDDLWRDIVRRWSEELNSGQVSPVPWDQVKRQAREKSRG
jgi:putative addiction module component (TIGR02574 family)